MGANQNQQETHGIYDRQGNASDSVKDVEGPPPSADVITQPQEHTMAQPEDEQASQSSEGQYSDQPKQSGTDTEDVSVLDDSTDVWSSDHSDEVRDDIKDDSKEPTPALTSDSGTCSSDQGSNKENKPPYQSMQIVDDHWASDQVNGHQTIDGRGSDYGRSSDEGSSGGIPIDQEGRSSDEGSSGGVPIDQEGSSQPGSSGAGSSAYPLDPAWVIPTICARLLDMIEYRMKLFYCPQDDQEDYITHLRLLKESIEEGGMGESMWKDINREIENDENIADAETVYLHGLGLAATRMGLKPAQLVDEVELFVTSVYVQGCDQSWKDFLGDPDDELEVLRKYVTQDLNLVPWLYRRKEDPKRWKPMHRVMRIIIDELNATGNIDNVDARINNANADSSSEGTRETDEEIDESEKGEKSNGVRLIEVESVSPEELRRRRLDNFSAQLDDV